MAELDDRWLSIGDICSYSDSYAGDKICNTGNIILNRFKAHLGVFALTPRLGVISLDYTVLEVIGNADPVFLEYILKSTKQRVILDAIAIRSQKTDQTIQRAESEIDLIQEYRTRLVSDIVTSKLDIEVDIEGGKE